MHLWKGEVTHSPVFWRVPGVLSSPGITAVLPGSPAIFPVSQFPCDKAHWERTLLACLHRKLGWSHCLWSACSGFSLPIHTTVSVFRMTEVKCEAPNEEHFSSCPLSRMACWLSQDWDLLFQEKVKGCSVHTALALCIWIILSNPHFHCSCKHWVAEGTSSSKRFLLKFFVIPSWVNRPLLWVPTE